MIISARCIILKMLEDVKYKRGLLDSAMNVINERQVQIAEKKKSLVHEITQTVVK